MLNPLIAQLVLDFERLHELVAQSCRIDALFFCGLIKTFLSLTIRAASSVKFSRPTVDWRCLKIWPWRNRLKRDEVKFHISVPDTLGVEL